MSRAIRLYEHGGAEQRGKDMVQGDLEHARRDAVIAREGFKTYRRQE